MSFHWQETPFDFYCLQIKLSRLVLYPGCTDGNCFCFHEQCFVFAFLKATKLPMPVPSFVHFPMVSSTPLARERGLKLCHCLLCLPAKIIPEAGMGSGSSVVPAGVPVWPTILLPLWGRQECLIPILWPGFCCIPQIVYVMCSAHLSRCYFIPAVSTKMTKLFMYSQLIVTCLWSVPAQKNKQTNKQANRFSNFK